jgi:hypothetical protein
MYLSPLYICIWISPLSLSFYLSFSILTRDYKPRRSLIQHLSPDFLAKCWENQVTLWFLLSTGFRNPDLVKPVPKTRNLASKQCDQIGSGLPDFLGTTYQNGKNYNNKICQMPVKYTKCP